MITTCSDEFKHNYYGLLKCDLPKDHTDENHYNYDCDVDWPKDELKYQRSTDSETFTGNV